MKMTARRQEAPLRSGVFVGLIWLGLASTGAAQPAISSTERFLYMFGNRRFSDDEFQRRLVYVNSLQRQDFARQQDRLRQIQVQQQAFNLQNKVRRSQQRSYIVPRRQPLADDLEVDQEAESADAFERDVLLVWRVLGASFVRVTNEDAVKLPPQFEQAMRVSAVRVSGPIDRAGLDSGEIIVGFGTYHMKSYSDLAFIAEELADANKQEIDALLSRNGEMYKTTLRLAGPAAAETGQFAASVIDSRAGQGAEPTIPVQNSDRDIAWNRLGVRGQPVAVSVAPYTLGFEVREIKTGSPADIGDLRVGDVIVGFDKYMMRSTADLVFIVQQSIAGPIAYLRIRNGEVQKGALTLSVK